MNYLKKFNNNVAMVIDNEEKEWIVIGKGISFGKRPGDKIVTSEIERRFLAEPSQDFSYIVQTIFSMDAELIEAVNEMIHEAELVIGVKLKDKNYITLLDHINFALKRTSEGIEYSAPLKWETKRLYPKEYQAAVQSIGYLNQRLGINLPKSEETFITMHYVNAQDGKEKLEQSDRINMIVRMIMTFVSDEYQIELDEESTNYIRFVTHLRYFIIRQINNESLKDSSLDRDLMMIIKEKYRRAYEVALGVSEKVRREEDWEITSNEVLYLTIHIWRVTSVDDE
ncbi:PRD domain-containing protein [Vagococcus sp. BWB3-3]|uniref:PRD domain-containing protein n=1 Tax=Vagococcus allomyrinae TaxID=2794353 RepID=A0A940PAZ3_9ENTE|nr:PRD domain-containing protein [Vagococcus allomyrinae]MBP1041410.1 PRD domain-containing protein [Vagococcus allomyrinae]